MLSPPQPFRPARSDWTHAALVAAALFALYASTSPRTVALEDDGLFSMASYYLGVAHPPGYPLHTMLGKLFTLLPFGSVAYRVHLLSAFFGALTGSLLWLCARGLVERRVPAYLAALGLGLTPVFWSQSIIAEVYTLNTFLFLLLVFLGLRASRIPQAASVSEERSLLPWMAFVFGLSLSNHWPLTLLVAPGFAILLWPRRTELLRRFPLLAGLVILGLLPYAGMVIRSWMWLPISFNGPLESLAEVWYFVSRAGYAGVDDSASASWLDRIKFFQFLAAQLLVQFAVVGTALAGVGVVVQRRILGSRIAAFLGVAFLMPSAVLLLLLGFDYQAHTKHVFHVYPLPAYAVVALWMALGFAWLARRLSARPAHAVAGCVGVLAVILAVGSRSNLLANYDFAARYAHAVLRTLPKDAVLFVKGDADLAPIAYFYLVESWRPDIVLYQSGGLVLGNRLFHPLRTRDEEAKRALREFIEQQRDPVAFTAEFFGGYARRDRWLFVEIDKSSRDPQQVTIDIPEEAVRFFEESILAASETNAWAAAHQNELRRRYALLLARRLPRGTPPSPRDSRHLAALSQDFHGALGLAEGLMANKEGYAVSAVGEFLDRARDLMPGDVGKAYQSSYFYLRGALRSDVGDQRGAIEDFETALSLWPVPDNRAVAALEELYRSAGHAAALKALQGRVKRVSR